MRTPRKKSALAKKKRVSTRPPKISAPAKKKRVSTGPGKTGTRPTEAEMKRWIEPAKKKRVSTGPGKTGTRPTEAEMKRPAKKKPTGIHPDAPKGANAHWGKPKSDGRSTTFIGSGGGRSSTPGGGRPNPRRRRR